MFRRGKRSKLENPSVLARACVRAPRMGRIGSRPAQAPIICGEWRVESGEDEVEIEIEVVVVERRATAFEKAQTLACCCGPGHAPRTRRPGLQISSWRCNESA